MGWVSKALVKLVPAEEFDCDCSRHTCSVSLSESADWCPELVSAIKPSPLIWRDKNPFFFVHGQQLVWPWAAVAWQWEVLQVLGHLRTLALAAGAALSSAWSLVLQRAAKISLTLQGTCQSCDVWGIYISMQICRFKTPRSCSASPAGRKGRGCRAISRLEGVSLALSLTWAELWPKDSSLELHWSISWFIILTVGNNVLLWSWIS